MDIRSRCSTAAKPTPIYFRSSCTLRAIATHSSSALKGKHWDAVIDDSGYVPRHVRLSAELLAPNVQHYIFISTISVYASFANPNTEDSPVGKLADETTEKVDGGAYGPLKALCEKAAEKARCRAALPWCVRA